MGKQVKKSISPGKVILIPTDFSAVAGYALLHALELARCHQYRICLLHVHHSPADTIINKEDPDCQSIYHDLQDLKLRHEQQYGTPIDILIRGGNLFKVISAVVAEIKPLLMVMGTHGKQGLQQLFGSHALRVVLDASCPVMVVQERPEKTGYRRILLPVNSEADPVQLTDWILHLCKLADSEIHLLQSMEMIPDRATVTQGITSQMITVFKEKGIGYKTGTAKSPNDFSAQVIEYANDIRSDLVMTMTTPAAVITGYNFSEWNERLMFNPGGIPVMFIDQPDTPG